MTSSAERSFGVPRHEPELKSVSQTSSGGCGPGLNLRYRLICGVNRAQVQDWLVELQREQAQEPHCLPPAENDAREYAG